MTLLHDEILRYQGFNDCDSCCRMRIFEQPDTPYVVLCTEVEDNDGTSITNCTEYLASYVFFHLLEHTERNMVWVEHYPADLSWQDEGAEESFDEVTFTFNPTQGRFTAPQWRPMTRAEVEALVGQPV